MAPIGSRVFSLLPGIQAIANHKDYNPRMKISGWMAAVTLAACIGTGAAQNAGVVQRGELHEGIGFNQTNRTNCPARRSTSIDRCEDLVRGRIWA